MNTSVNTAAHAASLGQFLNQLAEQQGTDGTTTATTGAPGALPGALNLNAPWVQELLGAALQLNNQDAEDGVVDANGAPSLPPSITDFSGDELALVLAAMDTKIKELQGKTAKEGIEAARQQTETANKKMLDKLQEAIDKQKEAEEKEKENKIWGWIGKIAAFIGAIVAVVAAAAATVASGGAATPLLAVAVLGLVAATVDLASQINQEVHPDAKPFTLGSLIGDAIIDAMDKAGIGGKDRAAASGLAAALGFILMQPDLAGQMAEDAAIANGVDPADAANIRLGVQIAAVVTTLVAMILLTIASGGASGGSAASNTATSVAKTAANSADDVASAATKAANSVDDVANAATKAQDAANKVIKASKFIQAGTQVVQGTAAIGGGVNTLQVGEMVRDADKARAAAKEIDAVLLQLQQQSDELTQRLKEIMNALQEGMAQFSQMIATAGDQRANQIKNLVRA